MQKKDEGASIGQPHVELLQALALQMPHSQQSFFPAGPEKVQEVCDLLLSLSAAFDNKRYAQLASAESEQEKAVMLVQERLRLHTHRVRNWGYFRNVIAIIRDLYGPLDPQFQEEVGVSATRLIDAFEGLVSTVEARFNEYRNRLRPAIQARTLQDMATEYYKAFPEIKDEADKLIALLESKEVPLRTARTLFLSHATLFLRDLFIFSISGISQMIQLPGPTLKRVLGRLSLSFGDLETQNPESFFLANPVWTRPLIHLNEDEYCCLLPQAFFSFALPILDGLLSWSSATRKACAGRRAEFLETEVERHIRRAFPLSPVERHFVWQDGDVQYETDLIARIDSYLLIVEAKSGTVSWPALRGAPARAKRHIEELLIAPAVQSRRLEKKIEVLSFAPNGESLLERLLPFDSRGAHETIRLSVTIEDLASIQTNLADIHKTGWLPADLEFAPTMSLADLQIVLETLSSVPERLHYLVRRAELERNMQYMGDEIDLLGLYLETGFNIAVIEHGPEMVILSGMSKVIDDYYEAKDHGVTRKKPGLKSTRWWSDIRKQIETRKPKRWSEAAVMLLNVSFDEQQKLERMFEKVVKRVKKSKYQPSYINSITLQPSQYRTDAFAIMAFREREREERHEKMDNLASNVFLKGHTRRCLIVGVNVDRREYPYSLLGVFNRNPETQ